MTSLGARLEFSRSGIKPANTGIPGTTGTPGIPGKPHVITINGKEFQITQVRMKVDGTWKDIDIKTLSSAELGELTDRCKKIFEKTKPTTNPLSKLSFSFEQNTETESLLSRTVGLFWSRFKNPPVAMNLKKIEFQAEGATESEVYKLEEAELDETAKAKLQNDFKEDLQGVAQITMMLFNKEHTKSKSKKIEQSPLHKVITDSIKDAGSVGNRCAALSLAQNELAKNNIDIEDVLVRKYDLDFVFSDQWSVAKGRKAQIKVLSGALVRKAAEVIANADPNNPFLNPHIKNSQQPCLAAIENALKEHQHTHPGFTFDNSSPVAKARAYAELILEPDVMLDLPFFLALGQPFIIIQKNSDNTNYEIRVIGHLFNIPGTIENCNLDNVNIVFYNGSNHYQSVILTSDQQKAALRQLIRKDITAQVDELINRLNMKVRGEEELVKESQDYQDLIRLYPAAREEILQRFQSRITADAPGRLREATRENFTAALRGYLHGISRIEGID